VARFMGTSLSAQLATTGAIQIFKTVIDGAPQAPFSAGVGSKSYDLATGLSADAAHTVELYRQSEGSQGETQLVALTVPDGTLMDPPPGPGRLIEVIGDSITCGFGDLSSIDDLNAPGTKCLTTESHWDTYEAVAARALGAEVSTIAISGKGVIRNYGGDTTTPTMPMYYGYTLTNVATPAWDFHIQPQAVVINLGTNDDSNGDPGTAYRDGYVTLLETVRAKYINALIVGIIAPMVNGGQLTVMQGYIQAAVDTRHAAGDANVEFLAIPAQTSAGYACDYHPNVAEHAMMGEMLTAELRAKLGW
jgi:lysophospholipase L1-like esterase